MSARSFTAPLADPLTPDGWTGDGTPKDRSTTLATLDFGGRMGLYDFTDNQWWNPLRTRRIVIRGSLGELVDDHVVRLVDPTSPVESHLVRRQTGIDLNLEGVDLDHISFDGRVVYRNPFKGSGSPRTTSPSRRYWRRPVPGRGTRGPSPTRWRRACRTTSSASRSRRLWRPARA